MRWSQIAKEHTNLLERGSLLLYTSEKHISQKYYFQNYIKIGCQYSNLVFSFAVSLTRNVHTTNLFHAVENTAIGIAN